MRRFLTPTAILAFMLTLAACNQGGDSQYGSAADTTANARAQEDTSAVTGDARFLDQMIPHHNSAIHMADMIIKDGSDPKIKQMAQTMRSKQQSEVEEMKTIRQGLGEAESEGADMDMDMPVAMDKMMALKGKELDRAFLQNMIPHHRQGVEMVTEHKDHLTNARVKLLAEKIGQDNQKEAGEMEQMLQKM